MIREVLFLGISIEIRSELPGPYCESTTESALYGSSFFRLCCLNWFVMKIRPSWKSVSETMALAMPMPSARIAARAGGTR